MKRTAIVIALVAVFLITSVALAAPTALNVPGSVMGSGGGHVVAGNFALDGTIGQAVANYVSANPYRVCSGFWCGLGLYKRLFPLIMR